VILGSNQSSVRAWASGSVLKQADVAVRRRHSIIATQYGESALDIGPGIRFRREPVGRRGSRQVHVLHGINRCKKGYFAVRGGGGGVWQIEVHQNVADENARRVEIAVDARQAGVGDPRKTLYVQPLSDRGALDLFGDATEHFGLRHLPLDEFRDKVLECADRMRAIEDSGQKVYPLAHLGLARAAALTGDVARSRKAYQDFPRLWKDADPDLPVLLEAKREYANLK